MSAPRPLDGSTIVCSLYLYIQFSLDLIHLQFLGDTSSDEVVGHLLAYTTAFHLVAETEEEKDFVRSLMIPLLDNILSHNFTLVGNLGNHTTWYDAILEFSLFFLNSLY